MAGTVPAQSKRCPPLRTTLRGPTAEWSRSRRAGAPGAVNSAAFLPCPPRQPGRLGATRPTDSLTPGRAPPSLARHTPLTRNPASLFPRPSPPRPLKSAKGTGSPAVDPEEIRSCIPPRDFARSSGRVVATGRPGRATLLQRRRTATSVSASSQTSLSVIAQPLRRWLRARSQGAPVAATCGLAAPVDLGIVEMYTSRRSPYRQHGGPATSDVAPRVRRQRHPAGDIYRGRCRRGCRRPRIGYTHTQTHARARTRTHAHTYKRWQMPTQAPSATRSSV